MWEAKGKKKQSENEEAEGESKPAPPKHIKCQPNVICTPYADKQVKHTCSRLLTALDFSYIFSKRRDFKISRYFISTLPH